MNKKFVDTLQNGLYFDGNDVLIPWLTPIEKMRNFAEPKIISESKKPSDLIYKTPYQYFIWEDYIWSKLHCNVQIQLYYEAKPPDWYQSNLFQYFYINLRNKETYSNVEVKHDFLTSQFTKLYSQPTKTGSGKDLYRDYPYKLWVFDMVQISIVMQERFVKFNIIMVKCLR